MSYLTIRNEGRAEFEEKKSVFIGHVKRVYSEEEAKAFIQKIKSEHKEARHNVFGYVLGENMGIQRYSDDGEPQGTGGIPVLETIKKNKITDTVVVVTRYFGGILLGAGGLTRAYIKGASLSIQEGTIVEKVKGCLLKVEIEYDLLGKVQYAFEKNQWPIEEIKYEEKVVLEAFFEVNKVTEVEQTIMNITSARCRFDKSKEKYYFKNENKLFEEK